MESIIKEWCLAQPSSELVPASEAKKLLSVSKQALSKGMKYYRKIFYYMEGEHPRYSKKSIEQFIKTGDGRFQIMERNNDEKGTTTGTTARRGKNNTIVSELSSDIRRFPSSKQKVRWECPADMAVAIPARALDGTISNCHVSRSLQTYN
jgi:hypothetical protein